MEADPTLGNSCPSDLRNKRSQEEREAVGGGEELSKDVVCSLDSLPPGPTGSSRAPSVPEWSLTEAMVPDMRQPLAPCCLGVECSLTYPKWLEAAVSH